MDALATRIEELKQEDEDSYELEQAHTEIGNMFHAFNEDNDIATSAGFAEKWRPLVIETTTRLKEDYTTRRASDTHIAQMASQSYVYSLQCQEMLASLRIRDKDDLAYLSVLSKNLETARRTYLSLIDRLESRNKPTPNIVVKTGNINIAKDQWIASDGAKNNA